MAEVSGVSELSGTALWIARTVARKQQEAAEKAAARAAEIEAAKAEGRPVPESDTVVTLSEEAKAKAAASDWYHRSWDALQEKSRLQKAQWSHAVDLNSGDTKTLYARCAKASAAEKEAFVQCRLIDFDTRMAEHALMLKRDELETNFSGSRPYLTKDEIASMRESTERVARSEVLSYSSPPPVVPTKKAPQVEKSAVQAEQARLRAELNQVRQKMGAGSGAVSDPAVQQYALSGPTSAADRLVEVQQRLNVVQSEYDAFVETAKKAAEEAGTSGQGVALKLPAGEKDRVEAWYYRALDTLFEKDRIESAPWAHGLRFNGDDEVTLSIRFSKASAAEKEAYVQRGLAAFDSATAQHALFLKYQALKSDSILSEVEPGYSTEEIARRREVEELGLRKEALRLSEGPASLPVREVRPQPTPEEIRAAEKAAMDRLRQSMDAGSGAADDPAVRKYAKPLPGPASTEEQLAAAQARIDAVLSEYDGIAQVWKDAAARGEKWAQPKS